MKNRIVVNAEAFDTTAAQMFMRQVLQKPDSTLCLATGGTTVGIFAQMVALKETLAIDCTRLKCTNLDEYVGVEAADPASCYYRVVQDLYAPLGLREEQFYVPVAPAQEAEAECGRFGQKLQAFGGIDLMLLSIGTNGHIAFNEPGTPFGSGIHIVDLAATTLKAKAQLFGGEEKVPRQGLTMGIADVMAARRIVLVAKGAHKAGIIRAALKGPVTEEIPASVLQLHPNLDVLLDEAAAG